MTTAATQTQQVPPTLPPQTAAATPTTILEPKPTPPAMAAELEAAVRELSDDLEKAEIDVEKTGRQFGQKLIELRELRKKSKEKGWMAYLEQVVNVSYEKARYWMNVVEEKSNHRHKHQFGAAPNSSGPKYRSAFEKPLEDWQDAQKRMNDFLVPLKRLHRDVKTGSDMLLDPLKELAALLGYKVEKV